MLFDPHGKNLNTDGRPHKRSVSLRTNNYNDGYVIRTEIRLTTTDKKDRHECCFSYCFYFWLVAITPQVVLLFSRWARTHVSLMLCLDELSLSRNLQAAVATRSKSIVFSEYFMGNVRVSIHSTSASVSLRNGSLETTVLSSRKRFSKKGNASL